MLYTMSDDDGIQATITKLIYWTLLACLRNIRSFGSKMAIKHYKINADLGTVERLIA
jgi:hypothetical protein